jgi:hypothetical protein
MASPSPKQKTHHPENVHLHLLKLNNHNNQNAEHLLKEMIELVGILAGSEESSSLLSLLGIESLADALINLGNLIGRYVQPNVFDKEPYDALDWKTLRYLSHVIHDAKNQEILQSSSSSGKHSDEKHTSELDRIESFLARAEVRKEFEHVQVYFRELERVESTRFDDHPYQTTISKIETPHIHSFAQSFLQAAYLQLALEYWNTLSVEISSDSFRDRVLILFLFVSLGFLHDCLSADLFSLSPSFAELRASLRRMKEFSSIYCNHSGATGNLFTSRDSHGARSLSSASGEILLPPAPPCQRAAQRLDELLWTESSHKLFELFQKDREVLASQLPALLDRVRGDRSLKFSGPPSGPDVFTAALLQSRSASYDRDDSVPAEESIHFILQQLKRAEEAVSELLADAPELPAPNTPARRERGDDGSVSGLPTDYYRAVFLYDFYIDYYLAALKQEGQRLSQGGQLASLVHQDEISRFLNHSVRYPSEIFELAHFYAHSQLSFWEAHSLFFQGRVAAIRRQLQGGSLSQPSSRSGTPKTLHSKHQHASPAPAAAHQLRSHSPSPKSSPRSSPGNNSPLTLGHQSASLREFLAALERHLLASHK